ncbi:ATP-binding cassette domain-containing protein [uncultured Pseudodesulfovibrio sp.]|uniref:ABC transporter ATP-binding protein n=1 Tax=uncultured Pseudodesulfovibrio sp. TaxID=2035858 RepID=UPI0029C87C2A|nr:ATP-binding cassette domain-containing protein [uncultured Pseudodesulfovibrio sp.]
MCLVLEDVTFAYPGGAVILEGASLTITQGGYYLVRGPSGSGKSTLLRLLCRLEEPQSGRIVYQETPVSEMEPARLRRTVAYVQQMPTLLKASVRDNLLLPLQFKANSGLEPPDDGTLNRMLGSFLLDGVTLDAMADSLSVGQAQRVCLIRSLLLRPEVLLMDEPTASLDAKSAQVVLDKAAELSRDGMTVVMISHSETTPEGVTDLIRINGRKLEFA